MSEENIYYNMDADGMGDSFRFAGFSLGHLLAAFISIAVLVFVVYLLWNCSCKPKTDDQERSLLTPSVQRIETKPMYAMELEPGVVLLQSQDGEFFRILHEYDAVKHQPRDQASPQGGMSLQGQTIHYIPHYTRAHMQTQATAPEAATEELMMWDGKISPPPYH